MEHNIPSSVMMGIFAPVVTDVCLTNPWTGLFSGEDLSIPGGVKPARTHIVKNISVDAIFSISSDATNGHISRTNVFGCFIHFPAVGKA